MLTKTFTLAFGGGCHWCTEAMFQNAEAAREVLQGFAAGPAPYDALSEAVLLTCDAADLPRLVELHLATHASRSNHSFRGKYRSAVYADGDAAETARSILEAATPKPVTLVVPLVRFEPSPERYRDYYAKRPGAPFCRTYIAPKLEAAGLITNG